MTIYVVHLDTFVEESDIEYFGPFETEKAAQAWLDTVPVMYVSDDADIVAVEPTEAFAELISQNDADEVQDED